jgi:hypothetical protein
MSLLLFPISISIAQLIATRMSLLLFPLLAKRMSLLLLLVDASWTH